MDCIIHIGTEKTGTTSIQTWLNINYNTLLAKRILYPQTPTYYNNHRKLAAYAMATDKVDDFHITNNIKEENLREKWNIEFENDLKHELNQKKGNVSKVIFSNEHLHSRVTKVEEINKLKELLNPFFNNIKILVYLRRQDEMCISHYSTAVKWGASNNFKFPTTKGLFYDYAKLLDRWATVFGKENLIVKVFDKNIFFKNDLIYDFAKTCNFYTEDLPESLIVNESVSNSALDFFVSFNKYIPLFKDNKPNNSRGNISTLIENKFSGKGKNASIEDAKNFVKLYEDSNFYVAKEYLGKNHLFNNNYDKYTNQSKVDELNIEKSIEISAVLWSEQQKTIQENREELNILRNQNIDLINFIRDIALKTESLDIELAYELMSKAYSQRPQGEFIINKLNEYLKKLKK